MLKKEGRRHSSSGACETVTVYLRFAQSAGPARILPMTRERWAQLGISIQFLIVVRTLGEILRLEHFRGTDFSAGMFISYIGGALIAACLCWAGVTVYFFRRYTCTSWIALASVVILLAYKVTVIGW